MSKATKAAITIAGLACALSAFAASSASAALPEIGRCLKLTGTQQKDGGKAYAGKYTNRKCTSESKKANGPFEWTAGPGKEKEWETPGSNEPVTLETVGGIAIACKNSKMYGEVTGEKTKTAKIGLYGCEDTATKEPCQSLRPEEVPPTAVEGTILSEEGEAELGYILDRREKPELGWLFKAKSGSDLFVFECGKPVEVPPLSTSADLRSDADAPDSAESSVAAPTLVTIEGSFIGRVIKPVNKMFEEFFLDFKAPGGKQEPEMFEGASKSVMSATIVKLPEAPKTEQVGYSAPSVEESLVEPYELRGSS